MVSVWVDSEVNKGSDFHFTVSLRLGSGRFQECALAENADIMWGLKVLVVDDNDTNRRILEMILQQWGMEPVCVSSGYKDCYVALDGTRDTRKAFSVALIDYMMPQMDGLKFVTKVREDPRFANFIIILLTSAGDRIPTAKWEKLGIADCLTKPLKLLDLRKAMLAPFSDSCDPRVVQGTEMPLTITSSPAQLRILLAEDNIINQKLATKILQKMGHTVTVASDGKETLSILGTGTFDLILMDVQMPNMDGLEATRIIREQEKATKSHIPIFAMTAYAMKGDREKCLDAGMDGYMAKPINVKEFQETLKKMAGKG